MQLPAFRYQERVSLIRIQFRQQAGNRFSLAGQNEVCLLYTSEAVVDGVPRIRLELLDAKGDTLVFLLDCQNDGFHFVALL